MTYDASGSAPSTPAKAAAQGERTTATHDNTPPDALLAFMKSQWKPKAKRKIALVKHAAAHARRRAALSALFPKETLLIPTGHEKVRANDTVYRFRPGSDFFYLTGNTEPDCALLLIPKPQGGHRAVLFVEPNPGKTDETFFTDRRKGELWVGPRFGVEESAARFGLEARGLDELEAMVKAPGPRVRVLRGLSPQLDAWVATAKKPDKDTPDKDAELAALLSELRLRKDPSEVVELRAVIASTKRGFEDVIRGLKTFPTERYVEGTFFMRARTEGNDVGYGTIAASGHHACTLHWTNNDGKLKRSDLLLLDAGVEGNSLYTADVTRTLPISGKFSKPQREVYELVWQAQKAAFTGVAPGNDFMEPNRRAMHVLALGLIEMGILKCSLEEALDEKVQRYKRYTLHNVSHMLGLDVHDCAAARQESYKLGQLKPGMVLTVEPGLYFQLDDLTVPVKYRGIGVRIEDDVIVTAKGMTNLSASIPSEADAVETWLKGVQRK